MPSDSFFVGLVREKSGSHQAQPAKYLDLRRGKRLQSRFRAVSVPSLLMEIVVALALPASRKSLSSGLAGTVSAHLSTPMSNLETTKS